MPERIRETASTPDLPQRRRDPGSHQAILQAALALVRETGYTRLTIEGIAAKAGVGKSTIYRWWTSKGDLVVEALTDILEPGEGPDTGQTRSDLIAIVQGIVDLYSDETAAQPIIAGLVSDMSHDPELAAALRERFVEPRRGHGRQAIARAIERGDLSPDVDIELILDVLVAPVFYRALVTGAPIEADLAATLVDLALKASSPASDNLPGCHT
jgi:AcrR family transcriptional regulator